MKTFVLVSALLAVSLAVPITDLNREWNQFKVTYQKNYETKTEESVRMGIFMANCRKINEHNELYKKGLVTYKMGIRKFADLTSEEFSARLGDSRTSNIQATQEFNKDFSGDDSIDWRDRGVVTDVKDQGLCSCSWAFSATGSLEGQTALLNGSKLYSISEQSLLDCSPPYGNHGCEGGSLEDAFEYVTNVTTINQEDDYPYEAKQGACRASDNNALATPPLYTIIKSNNDSDLDFFVSYVGPISSSIAVGKTNLHLYAEGVYSQPENEDDDEPRHHVLVIGYGDNDNDNDGPFWLIKDSLGTGYADGGYWKLARHANNALGIGTTLVFPLYGEL